MTERMKGQGTAVLAERIVEAMQEGVLVISMHGKIIRSNPEFFMQGERKNIFP